MLHSIIKNYDEFKEMFTAKNADGTTRRKNGILLSFYKSKEMREWFGMDVMNSVRTVSGMYTLLYGAIQEASCCWWNPNGRTYNVNIMGKEFHSPMYATDGHNGVCVDGDLSAYRYENKERGGRVFKMKVGKMFRHLMDLTDLGSVIPETVKLYLCEELTREWEAYVSSRVPGNEELVLHIDDNFKGIYSQKECGNLYFHSCMQGDYKENWMFYRDSVKAHAAYLTEGEDGYIVARCVIFDEVTREDTGEVIRVAERQYSRPDKDNSDYPDEILQRLLVKKLVDGGYIDAYKKPGAGCGDANAFVDKDGNDMSDVHMHIECNLLGGDHLSYQDSFKWYDMYENTAYNYYVDTGYEGLDSTNEYYDYEENYDSYHERYTDNDVAVVYWHGRDYTCDSEDMDDFVYIEYGSGKYEYHHEDDVVRCEDIDDYVLEDDAYYSEILGEYYYDESAMCEAEAEYKAENWYYSEITEEYYETTREKDEDEQEYKESYWHYSEYDEEYYEDEDDIVVWLSDFYKSVGKFERQTISYETVCELIESGEAVKDEETGIYYSKKALDEVLAA